MKKNLIVLIVLILIFSNCMTLYVLQENRILNQLGRMVLLAMVLVVAVSSNRYPRTKIVRFCYMLMFWQLLSMAGAYFVRGQGFVDSFIVTCYAFIFLFVPLLYILKIDERTLLRLSIIIGIWFAIIQVVQQFTYPTYWFAARGETDEHEIELRNGIYRFAVGGTTFGLITLFYALQRYLEVGKRKYLLLQLVGIVGIYMTCTRQVMAASAGCILVGLWLKGKIKGGAIFGLALVAILIYANIDLLFGDYIEMTEEVDEDYIRFVCYEFYGLEYNKGDILASLIGNGLPRLDHSAYGRETEMIMTQRHLFRSDIGLVGEYSFHGIFYVLTILCVFWYVFKNRKYIDLYLQLYMLYSCVTSVMLLHFHCSLGTYGTCIVLYMIDRSIARHKRLECELQSRPCGGGEEGGFPQEPSLQPNSEG